VSSSNFVELYPLSTSLKIEAGVNERTNQYPIEFDIVGWASGRASSL